LVRWRIQRVSVTPEDAGLCGCWQFIAVWREQKELRQGKVTKESEEYSFYDTSLAKKEASAPELLEIIRGHWSACEIGSHYRRDVSLREDQCRISGRGAAYVMATLRNLVLGLFELQQDRGKTKRRTFPTWRRNLTQASMIQLITQKP
jgi:predicted transposase YbfD/YdcC